MLMFASAQITMDYRDQRSAITPLTMSLTLLMTLTLLVMPSGVWSQSAGSFDQALNRPITASVTCGTGNDITYEMYYSHSEIFLSSVDRVNKICNSELHNPQMMVDGSDGTWWQSTSLPNLINLDYAVGNNPASTIELDLQQTFAVDIIRLEMGDSKRPGRIAVKKSMDGTSFQNWLYIVTEEAECLAEYNVQPASMPTAANSTLCQIYPNNMETANETITFNLPTISSDILDFLSARKLKFEFDDMHYTMGLNGGKFQHFTVVSISVFANCTCSGHEVDCQPDGDTGQYTCVCGGNTQGANCESCLPFYNHQPYRLGVDCVECNCFNHSDVCVYDSIVGANSMSIGATGNFDGGGSCMNCRDNTAGFNCESCVDFYYNPVGRSQLSVNACVPCDCHSAGVTANPSTGLTGDCVKTNDMMTPPGMAPGDCFCKTNVQGSRCDECKPGFYNLHATNPDGCTPCYCDVAGTVGSSFQCEPTGGGQCQCKTFVTSRECNQCMDGYWGLSVNNTDGCSPCECDIGGSLTTVCNKDTGQCTCRSNIGGRQCNDPNPNFYVPSLHATSGQFEEVGDNWHNTTDGYVYIGYAILQQNDTKSTRVSIATGTSFSGNYYLVIRYNTPSPVTGSVTVDAIRTVSDGTFPATFLACVSPWCSQQVGQATSTQFALISGESTLVTVELTSTGTLELDEAVFVPIELVDTTAFLGDNAATFQQQCNVITNTYTNQAYCDATVFSLMARYYGGALACNCGILGSNLTQPCETFGGQCSCKPGVGGRQCDVCLPGYFRLTNTGCEACGCAGAIITCNSITGQCDCPPHGTGRMCDECVPNYWNWVIDVGCEACNCDTTGSRSLQCNLTSGACDCKSGIGGLKCDRCLDGYKMFSVTGCRPCGCVEAGSLSTVCNPASGQCPCKNNTQGLLCHECTANSFSLQADYEYGCQSCVCMGITQSCSATTLRIDTVNVPIQNADSSINFLLVMSLEAEQSPNEVISTEVDMVDMLQAPLDAYVQYYWQPAGTTLTGNLISMYGLKITYAVYYPAMASGTRASQRLAIFGFNNTQFFFPVTPNVELNARTTVSVTLSDTYATSDANGQTPVTREELLLGLTEVGKVLIPTMVYSDMAHQSFIGSVSYQQASTTGLGSTATTVEQCTCGEGYLGLSCETCADGFRREEVGTHEFLGTCVGCECNNHATACDSTTGQCLSCQHHTTGFHCEVCEDGYYGDATLGTAVDCNQCPCVPPRVVNSTCVLENTNARCSYCMEGYSGMLCNECDMFYYGNPEVPETGTCTMCFCNGNSQTCDPVSGSCINCTSNTTGFHCEHCENTTYGNATTQSCAGCGCQAVGSTSDICNIVTGDCSCHPGVGGRTCDACIADYYGYGNDTFAGCVPCNCNTFGSANTQCADTGVCTCLDHVDVTNTVKCDRCVEGFFGLPNAACQLCNCDTTGTIDPSLPCDLITGECQCKPGVTGRRCDECDFMYTHFGPNGCVTCDECSTVLGNDTKDLTLMYEQYWNLSQVVGEIQQQDLVLMGLMDDINNTLSSLGLSSANLSSLLALAADVTDMEPTHRGIVLGVQTRADLLEADSIRLYNDSTAMLDTQSGYLADATDALELGTNTNTLATAVQAQFADYNTSAQQSLRQFTLEGQTDSVDLTINFDSQKAEAEGTLANLTAIVETATDLRHEVQVMINETTRLTAQGNVVNETIQNLEEGVANATTTLADILEATDATMTLYNQTMTVQNYSLNLFTAATQDLQLAQGTLNAANQKSTTATAYIDDTFKIRDGTTGPLPVDTSVNLLGVTSWNNGVDRLKGLLISVPADITAHGAMVTTAEATATTLNTQIGTIVNEFNTVQARGQAAVDAIQTYEEVASNLATSVDMASQAEATINQVTAELQRVTVAELQQRATTSLTTSRELNATVDTFSSTPTVLAISMNAANNSLHLAVGTWDGIDAMLPAFLQTTQEVSDAVSSSTLSQNIESGFTDVAMANIKVNTVSTKNNQTDAPAVDTQAERLTATQTTLTNSNTLLATLNTQVTSLNSLLDNEVQSTLDQIQVLSGTTAGGLTNLTTLLNTLEAKVNQAYNLMVNTEQPVRFGVDTYLAVSASDITDASTQYDEVSLEFQFSTTGEGVLFFRENPATTEVIALYIMANELHFRFATVDESLDIISQAELCAGCWFKVVATRYGVEGHLVVIKMSTGGVASNHFRGTTANNALVVTNSAYIGGLPAGLVDYNQTTPKIPMTAGFAGCIWNVQFDEVNLPVWNSVLQENSTASCCARPPAIPGPDMIPGYCFSGFGYAVMPPTNISITGSSMVKFQFRTYDADGVFVMVDRAGLSAYWGVFLDNGQVVFEYGTSASAKTTRQSAGTSFNDGQWHEVTAMHNSTHAQLVVQEVNGTELGAVDMVVNVAAVWDLSEIAGEGLMTWGGQNPDTISKGPVTGSDSGFAGCMRNVQIARTGSGLVPTDLDVASLATSVSMVSFAGCYSEVIHGLSFMSSSSYALLTNFGPATSLVYEVELTFITYDNSGILVYGTPSSQNSFFSIALHNGNVQVLFLQSSQAGIQPVLTTYNMYLADGFPHDLFVSFREDNKPRMRVDGVTITGDTDSNGYMYIGSSGSVYIGGVPSSVNLNPALPVRSSLVGGITRLVFNMEHAMNLFIGSTYRAMADISLCGLPMSPDSLPPPPYSTTPAPPTTPAPTCAPATEPGFSTSGIQFLRNSYVDVMQYRAMFMDSFTIKIRFRTTAPNGLLFYGANKSPNPEHYIAIFLYNGNAVASMDTNSAISNAANPQTKLVTVAKRYDDGQFHDLTLLRINDFMALVSPDNEGYTNNAVSSHTESRLNLTFAYVAGVPNSVAGLPFATPTDVPLAATTGLYGCIDYTHVVVRSTDDPMVFDLSNGVNTAQCYQTEEPGLYLMQPTSYFTLPGQSIVFNKKYTVSFKTSGRNGTLAAMYLSSNNFLLLDIYEGIVHFSLANAAAPGTPVVVQTEIPAFSLCDNSWHTASFFVRTTQIELEVDGVRKAVGFPPGFILPSLGNGILYLGGINDFNRDFGVTWSKRSLPGCMRGVQAQTGDTTTTYNVDNFGTFQNTVIGCPI